MGIYKALQGKTPYLRWDRFSLFFALTTSFLGVSFSVVDFLNDGMKLNGSKRPILVLLTFVPPGLCAALNPGLFEAALGVAGGFGEAFLNGVLPVALAWKLRSVLRERGFSAFFLALLFVFGIFVIGIEGVLLFK